MNVLDKLDELYNWWFDPQNHVNWFDSSKSNDELISNKFGYLLDPESHEAIKIQINNFNFTQSIGYIILYDQVLRHWARHKNLYNQNLIKINYLLIEKFIDNFYQSNKNIINGYDFCFILLPFRHTNDYLKIKFVLEETWAKLESESDLKIKQIYIKYLKATYERADYKVLNSKPYLFLDYDEKESNMHENIENYVSKYKSVLDVQSIYSYNPNYKNYDVKTCPIAQACANIPITTNLIVSISGGVDSMVISWVLKKLGYNIILLHINYANRPDTDLEQDMVESWATYLGVKIFYRKLDEINRPKCMEYELRSIYETYTRDQRYQSYMLASLSMGWFNYMVVLGHNHDDCVENIFTNITSKTKYENLYGMKYFSEVGFKNKSIKFVRPMLSIDKKTIYKVALDNNILFLWDSTPKWSQRGKLRDLVRPALLDFNPEVFNGLNELVKILEESMNCVDSLVLNYINKIDNSSIVIGINELNETTIFWDKFITKMGMKISHKCIVCLIEKVTRFKNTFISKQLNFTEKFQINKDKKIGFKKVSATDLEIIFL